MATRLNAQYFRQRGDVACDVPQVFFKIMRISDSVVTKPFLPYRTIPFKLSLCLKRKSAFDELWAAFQCSSWGYQQMHMIRHYSVVMKEKLGLVPLHYIE